MRAVFLLVKVEPGKLRQVADAFGDLEVCSEIYSTAGDFDLLAKIYVESFDDLADLVTDKIQKVPNIRETKSILTFRTYKEPKR